MTLQEKLEAGLTPCPNPMRTKVAFGRIWGYHYAEDFWLQKHDGAVEQSLFTIVRVTGGDDQFIRVIIGRHQFMIGKL